MQKIFVDLESLNLNYCNFITFLKLHAQLYVIRCYHVAALEEESDKESHSDRLRRRSPSPASQGSLHDDRLSIRSNQGSYSDSKSKSVRVSRQRDYSESDDDSVTSNSSSSSSSSSETAYTTTTTTTTTAQRERDDQFYDDSRGPTITLRSIKEKRVESDSDPQRKAVSVESSSQDDGKEFVHGYEVGLYSTLELCSSKSALPFSEFKKCHIWYCTSNLPV